MVEEAASNVLILFISVFNSQPEASSLIPDWLLFALLPSFPAVEGTSTKTGE